MPVAELEVRGLGARFRRPGIGAPLAARPAIGRPSQTEKDFLAPRVKVPVTALLRIDDPRDSSGGSRSQASIELYDGYDRGTVDIDGRAVPLEVRAERRRWPTR